MDPGPDTGSLNRDGGFASLQFVVAAGLAMLMVAGLMQLVTYQYVRGAVMAALERGVRVASVAGSGPAECEASLSDSLASVLGGRVGESLQFGCEADGPVVRAWSSGTVPGWVGSVTDLSFQLETTARREVEG